MKFAKLLQSQVEEMPHELRGKFLCYKELKKLLKGLPPPTPENSVREGGAGAGPGSASLSEPTRDERTFISKLNLEISKFNDYFIRKEEENVIRVADVQSRIEGTTNEEELFTLRHELVELHGEMVFLLHWCELNYIALVKILKKHDKKTGILLRSPYLASVVGQPFYSTTILKNLLETVEGIIKSSLSSDKQKEGADATILALPQLVPDDDSGDESDELVPGDLMKQTRVAINMWQVLQKAKFKSEGADKHAKRANDGEEDNGNGVVDGERASKKPKQASLP